MPQQYNAKAFVLLFSIMTMINVSELKAQGNLENNNRQINIDIGQIYDIDFFPGINKGKQYYGYSFLQHENHFNKNLVLIESEDKNGSSLNDLQNINVAEGNILRIRLNPNSGKSTK